MLPFVAAESNNVCREHRISAGEYVDGPVTMGDDPLAQFDTPMITTFNSSTSEVWAFDAGSDDGKTAIVIYLSRGTVASNLAAQRALISVSWPNGTRYMESVFLDESTVTSCPGFTVGTWLGKDDDGAPSKWSFTASRDLKHTNVSVKTAKIQGNFHLERRGPPLYPGGLIYPDQRASVKFAPEMYWQEHVPVASASADFTINGTPYTLSGVGGRDKNWLSRPWAVISGQWDMARAIVGPYGLMFWNYTSSVDGQSYMSATLMENGKVIFRTTNEGAQHSQSDFEQNSSSYCSVKLTDTGPVHLSAPSGTPPPSRHTGYVVDMLSARKHWRFVIDYSQTTFWFPASETLSVGQYVAKVAGGLVDGYQYEGVASGSMQEYTVE